MKTAAPYFLNVLNAEFNKRKKKNPRYSLRAFAKFLELDPSTLSRIIAGKQHASIQVACKLIKRLGLDASTSQMVAASIAEQAKTRTAARFALEPSGITSPAVAYWLDPGTFDKISDICALGILEATSLTDFDASPSWIAKRLNIAPPLVEQTIKNLIEVGLLKREGNRLVTIHTHMWSDSMLSDVPLKSRYQAEILERASEALTKTPRERRSFSGLTMAIDPANLPLAREMIRNFIDELCESLGNGQRTQIYQMGVQLYPLQAEETN